MKTIGWIFLGLGIINFIMFLIGVSQGEPRATTSLSGAIMLGVLGAFLISRANKKEQEEKDKENWRKS